MLENTYIQSFNHLEQKYTTKIPAVTSKVLILTFSHFLNHIESLIRKNPNLPSTNHQHNFKAS